MLIYLFLISAQRSEKDEKPKSSQSDSFHSTGDSTSSSNLASPKPSSIGSPQIDVSCTNLSPTKSPQLTSSHIQGGAQQNSICRNPSAPKPSHVTSQQNILNIPALHRIAQSVQHPQADFDSLQQQQGIPYSQVPVSCASLHQQILHKPVSSAEQQSIQSPQIPIDRLSLQQQHSIQSPQIPIDRLSLQQQQQQQRQQQQQQSRQQPYSSMELDPELQLNYPLLYKSQSIRNILSG